MIRKIQWDESKTKEFLHTLALPSKVHSWMQISLNSIPTLRKYGVANGGFKTNTKNKCLLIKQKP